MHPADDIFHDAREITDPAKRAAFLDEACAGDADLRATVEQLLRADAELGGFLASRAGGQTTLEPVPPSERAGSRIGPYKLLQPIGEGGFGTVFLAEQDQPLRRKVAVKVIKLGMDSRQVIARFEAERQALAMMNHPHIARVFDGGVTDSGRPYFVMEYVVGDAITPFCDAHKLSVHERLDLFQQVCAAVQHAHTKGIIHRDLKPANVLVSMVDGKPFAKVIDFGIAKATASPLTDKTLFTEHRQLIGTPEYMSPEQAEGSPDIDTRTDVYALGVLLYELLTGLTPFDAKRLRSAAYAEMQRIIKEEDPPAPSLRLARSLGTLATAAATRGVEPGRLNSLVKGELDWIVMKALDKNRARRYETAVALAADVQRHLSGEAVVAAPPSAGYRVRKFVRRHRGPVTAGSAVVIAVLAGSTIALVGWKEAAALARAKQNDQERAAATVAATFSRIFNTDVPWHMKPEPGLWMSVSTTIDRETRITRAINRDGPATVSSVSKDGKEQVPPLSDSLDALGYVSELAISGLDASNKELLDTNERLRAQSDSAEWSAYTANLALAQQAMEAGNNPEARQRLAECPEGRRGWEWRYLSTISNLGQAPWESGDDTVYDLAHSPDGSRVAAAYRGGCKVTTVWDAHTGELLATLPAPGGSNSVTFSADGSRLLICGLGHASLWDIETEQMVYALPIDPTSSPDATFSRDGTLILTHEWAKPPQLWDASSGDFIVRIPLDMDGEQAKDGLGDAALSADGTRVITAHFNHAKVWDARTGQLLRILVCEDEQARDIRIASDDRSIMGFGFSNEVVIWDAQSGEVRSKLALKETGGAAGAQFSRDGNRIVTYGYGRGVRVWEAATGALIQDFQVDKPKGWHEAGFTPDGSCVAIWGVSPPSLYDIASGERLMELVGHSFTHGSAASPDRDSISTLSDEGALRHWKPRPPLASSWRAHDGFVSSIQFSSDGTHLLSSTGREWTEWDIRSMSTTRQHSAAPTDYFPGYRRQVAYMPDDAVLSWFDAAEVSRISDVDGPSVIVPPSPRSVREGFETLPSQPIRDTSIVGNKVLTATRDGFRVTDVNTGEVLLEREVAGSTRSELANCGSRILSVIFEKSVVRVFDAAKGDALYELPGQMATFDPTGTRILTLSRTDDGARIWDATTGREICRLDILPGQWENTYTTKWLYEPNPDFLDSCAFSPDGTRVVFPMERREVGKPLSESAYIYDTGTGERVAELRASFGAFARIEFSPDGTRIATYQFIDPDWDLDSQLDNGIRVWNAEAGLQLLHLEIPTLDGYGITSLAWSTSGDILAAGGYDGQITVFDATPRSDRLQQP